MIPVKRSLMLFLIAVAVGAATLFVPFFAASCGTLQAKDEAQALEMLRSMTRGGNLPYDERQLTQIEADHRGARAGALARIVRARVKLKAGDAAGAAQLLDAREIRERTALGDYAQLLRGRAFEQAKRIAEARAAYEKLAREYPTSIRAREAALRNAELVSQEGAAAAVPALLADLYKADDPQALLLTARAYEQQSDASKALIAYRRLYFYAPAAPEAAEAAAAISSRLGSNVSPASADEAITRPGRLLQAKQYADAASAYEQSLALFPALATPENKLRHGIALANTRRATDAVGVLLSVTDAAPDVHAEALYNLSSVYANTKQWAQARAAAEQMRRLYPQSNWTVRALVDAGGQAREAGNAAEAFNFFRAAVSASPARAETAPAQFELAWSAHEAKNYGEAARLLIEHVAEYADKNTDFRGRAGYWAARNAERAGRLAEARALYEAMGVRYDATWYGYLAKGRLAKMSRTASPQSFAPDSPTNRAVANLKTVTVADETAGAEERRIIAKANELSIAGCDEWALEELSVVQGRMPHSPEINLATARIHRAANDNVTAFNVLRRSFPDYSQMHPEELTREQWDVFYPLANWDAIVAESRARSLDPHQVAGLIRQESVFNPRARSSARAYGLMQVLVPTGRLVAQKYGVGGPITEEALYEPRLNIQLGTAYMREQLNRFGLFEHMAAAYNAGPGRAIAWRATLPAEIDEWTEAIPFRETRGYVQGVVRNMLQYRRLYDEEGKFRPEVGTRALRPSGNQAPPEGQEIRARRAG